jgi:hypothetical protein
MKRAYLLLAVAACSSSDGIGSGDDYHVQPPGVNPGRTGGTPGDAGTGDGDGGTGDGGAVINGRICVLDDLREFSKLTTTACDTSVARGGLNVRLDGKAVLTATDGTFQIPTATSSDAVWKVDSGASGDFVTTFMPYASQTVIPVITTVRYNEIQSGSQVTLPAEGAGSVLVRVVRAGASLANVTATVNDSAGNPTVLYDGTAADNWANLATGKAGLVLFAGVTANVNGSATPATGALKVDTTTTAIAMTVWDQAITFVTKSL